MKLEKLIATFLFGIALLLIFAQKLTELLLKMREGKTDSFHFYLSAALALLAAFAAFRILTLAMKDLVDYFNKNKSGDK